MDMGFIIMEYSLRMVLILLHGLMYLMMVMDTLEDGEELVYSQMEMLIQAALLDMYLEQVEEDLVAMAETHYLELEIAEAVEVEVEDMVEMEGKMQEVEEDLAVMVGIIMVEVEDMGNQPKEEVTLVEAEDIMEEEEIILVEVEDMVMEQKHM